MYMLVALYFFTKLNHIQAIAVVVAVASQAFYLFVWLVLSALTCIHLPIGPSCGGVPGCIITFCVYWILHLAPLGAGQKC